MSDGRNWYPGGDDPRYDPYAPPQQPPQQRRPQQYPPRQQPQPYPPQQPQQPPAYHPPGGQGQPQPGRGTRGLPPRPDGPDDPYAAPPRRPQPPRQRPRYDGPPEPHPPRRQAADSWQAPGHEAEADRDEAPPARRRRAGTGPGRQTDAPTTPGHVNADVDLDELDPSGRARRAWAKQQSGGRSTRARQATKWGAIGMSLVLVAAVGFAGYVYETTFGSLKSTPLMPGGMTQAPLAKDKYGNLPLNILLIGSDTRAAAADCHLGGDCGTGANADSEMILHVSAERTNATIISIPRDTVAYLPDCSQKNGTTSLTGNFSSYQINSALQYGPACQVAAVHYLSKITITGYILFDFSGIVTMSNALGGVPVCVTHAVNDRDSGLKLPAGQSTIQGDQTLEFLRTRHSFFDGSDLGREMATHYFLSQLIATMRKNMNLGSIDTLLRIGQAAAKATTVSNNFTNMGTLEGLIGSLNKVPSKNITMMTMPWEYDPHNPSRVIPENSAATVFANIQNDVSFTATKPSAKPAGKSTPAAPATSQSPSPSQSVDKSQVPVHVYNANKVPGRATAIAQALSSAGFSQARSGGNANPVDASQIWYTSSDEQAGARAAAAALGIPSSQVQQHSGYPGVSVFVGADFTSGTTLTPLMSSGASAPAPDTSGAATAPSESRESFATDSSSECVPWFSGSGPGTLSMVHN